MRLIRIPFDPKPKARYPKQSSAAPAFFASACRATETARGEEEAAGAPTKLRPPKAPGLIRDLGLGGHGPWLVRGTCVVVCSFFMAFCLSCMGFELNRSIKKHCRSGQGSIVLRTWAVGLWTTRARGTLCKDSSPAVLEAARLPVIQTNAVKTSGWLTGAFVHSCGFNGWRLSLCEGEQQRTHTHTHK